MSGVLRISSFLGVLLGSLSIILLVKHGLNVGFIGPFQLIIEYYEKIIHLLLGWADAPLLELIRALSEGFGIRIQLFDHWKYVFVLMFLYFSSDSKANIRLGRYKFAVFSVLWGALVALVFSIATGTIALDAKKFSLLGLAFPIIGLTAFELGRSAWSATFSISTPSFSAEGKSWSVVFWHCIVSYALPILIIGGILHIVGELFFKEEISILINPTLLLLLSFVVLLAFYWLGRAAWLANYDRYGHESWSQRFLRSGTSHVGFLMLSAILGATLFLSLNAGLNLVGL